jgi:hypothetical protein
MFNKYTSARIYKCLPTPPYKQKKTPRYLGWEEKNVKSHLREDGGIRTPADCSSARQTD